MNTKHILSSKEVDIKKELLALLKRSPLPSEEQLANLSLFITRQHYSRMIFMHEMYKKIVGLHGVIMEFGVRWGKDLTQFQTLHGMFEPYNHTRKIIGFDTFSGFPSVHENDGKDDIVATGSYAVTEGYEDYLRNLLFIHEQNNPVAHINKIELVKGDVIETLPEFLKQNQQTIIALAYFDLDIYEPTKVALELLKPHLQKGSVLGFDEAGSKVFPGETVAIREALGLNNISLQRFPFDSAHCYCVVE